MKGIHAVLLTRCEYIHEYHVNRTVLLVASKEIHLEAHAEKTKYMATSLEKNSREYHIIKISKTIFWKIWQILNIKTIIKNLKISLRMN
jgi:heterodisulfide reductase subunit B